MKRTKRLLIGILALLAFVACFFIAQPEVRAQGFSEPPTQEEVGHEDQGYLDIDSQEAANPFETTPETERKESGDLIANPERNTMPNALCEQVQYPLDDHSQRQRQGEGYLDYGLIGAISLGVLALLAFTVKADRGDRQSLIAEIREMSKASRDLVALTGEIRRDIEKVSNQITALKHSIK